MGGPSPTLSRSRINSSHGYDAMSQAVSYGFEGHFKVAWPGVIVSAILANEHDRWVAGRDLLPGVEEGSSVVDDANHHPIIEESRYGINLVAPARTNKKREVRPWPRWLTNTRRRMETVTSQMVEPYGAKRVRARDPWHLASRRPRKILGHALAPACFWCKDGDRRANAPLERLGGAVKR